MLLLCLKTGSRAYFVTGSLANDLKRYSLMFMEQLVNADGNQMLTFFDYCIRSNIPHSPKSPKWYDTLQTALLKDNSSRDTVAHFQHI
ncbi:18856_t:CDS:2, partial [Funneliformis geosporum]